MHHSSPPHPGAMGNRGSEGFGSSPRCLQPVMAEAGLEPGSELHDQRPLTLCTWLAQELGGSHLLPLPGHRETFSRTGKSGCNFPSFSMVPSVFQTVIGVILRSPGLPVAGPPPDPLKLVGIGVEQGLCAAPRSAPVHRAPSVHAGTSAPHGYAGTHARTGAHAAAKPRGAVRLTGSSADRPPFGSWSSVKGRRCPPDRSLPCGLS